MDPEEAMTDFKKRRENYLKVYETVEESDGPHVKIINSKKFIVCNIRGYLPLKVCIMHSEDDVSCPFSRSYRSEIPLYRWFIS